MMQQIQDFSVTAWDTAIFNQQTILIEETFLFLLPPSPADLIT